MENYRIFENKEYEEVENDKEKLDQRLNAIDFARLRAIFGSLSKSAGITEPNLPSREMIYTQHETADFDHDSNAGSYYPNSNKILLNTKYFEKFDDSDFANLELAHVLIHEGAHAVSRNECSAENTGLSEWKVSKFGIKKDWINLFENFDEAITERLARKLTRQYIETLPEREKLIQYINEGKINTAYNAEVTFLEFFTSKISEKTGVSREIVEEGIISDYLNNTKVLDTELEKELEECFYEGIMKEIATIEDPADINDLILNIRFRSKLPFIGRVYQKIKMLYKGV